MTCEKIGQRIKTFREERQLGIQDMATRTGLDQGLLEAVEAGQATPALGPLVKIARVLGCRLGTLLDDVHSVDPCIVRRAEREKEFALQASVGNHPAQAYYALGKNKADRHMEPFYIELAPANGGAPELSSHEGEEFIMVASGTVRLTYGAETFELEAGDSMFYNSIVPHHVGCAGDEKATIHAVVYVPC